MKTKLFTTHTVASTAKSIFTLLALVLCLHAGAQSTAAANDQTPIPTAVMKGPAKGTVNGSHLFITAEVRGGQKALVKFSISGNHSGASIVSQGTFVYDDKTGIGEQIVEINPGSSAGSFTVKAKTTNAKGEAESSMTVAVVN